jgi:polysaccharide biosynthesis transport protein
MKQASAQFSNDTHERILSLWRRRRTFAVVAAATTVVTVLIALLLPPTYQSTATILIEQQEIPQELVRSVITSYADARIQVISQRVMTTQNLLSLIERYDLYRDVRQKEPREELLKDMRDDIGLKMISADVIDPRSGRPQQATIAFSVSYRNRSPDLALKVANELATLYLNENLTQRTQTAQQTASFFSEQSARQAAHIADLDKALAAFKAKYHDELPELAQINIQEIQRTELEMRDAQNRLDGLDTQRVLLQAQLAQLHPNSEVFSDTGQRVFSTEDRLKALKSQLASYKARYAPEHPDIVSTQREVDGLEKEVIAQDQTAERLRQLSAAKSELSSLLEKYSDDHPDVIRLRRTVDRLQKAVDREDAAITKRIESNHADNPVYIQVKGQLDAIDVDRQGTMKKREELHTKLQDYEDRLAKSPEVERQYHALTRDFESAQVKYQEILAKQTEVQVSENLETERKGEKFTMIEPPQPPEKPIRPNRMLILAAGLVLSIGLGIAAVVTGESIDGSVRGPGDIVGILQVPALASIPVIFTAADRARRKMIALYSWAGSITAVALAAATLHFFVKPLDVVWLILLRRLGV